MPFKVVQTLENKKNKITLVPSGWETDNILRYPKRNQSKYVRDENAVPGPDWDIMKCKVKRRNIKTYEAGEELVTEMSMRRDTDDDDPLQPQRPPNNQIPLNLNFMVEKPIGNDVVTNENFAPIMPSFSANLPNDYQYTYLGNSQNSTIPSANNVYQVNVPEETINNTAVLQDTVTFDIDKLFENQKLILENQATIMSQLSENQKQLSEITGHIRSLTNVQNNLVQKISGFSVQLDDAVSQIGVSPNNEEVTTLKKSSKRLENIPLHIKPVDSPLALDELETQLSDNEIRNRMKNTYSIICSEGKAIDCAYILVDIMFTRSFICQCSWSGGSRGDDLKVALKGYKHVLSFFWEMIHFWDDKYSLKDNESFFKTILKNAHKRKLAKLERASTSRKRIKIGKKKAPEENNASENKIPLDENDKQCGQPKDCQQPKDDGPDTNCEHSKDGEPDEDCEQPKDGEPDEDCEQNIDKESNKDVFPLNLKTFK